MRKAGSVTAFAVGCEKGTSYAAFAFGTQRAAYKNRAVLTDCARSAPVMPLSGGSDGNHRLPQPLSDYLVRFASNPLNQRRFYQAWSATVSRGLAFRYRFIG